MGEGKQCFSSMIFRILSCFTVPTKGSSNNSMKPEVSERDLFSQLKQFMGRGALSLRVDLSQRLGKRGTDELFGVSYFTELKNNHKKENEAGAKKTKTDDLTILPRLFLTT